jgi:hypothetical protein
MKVLKVLNRFFHVYAINMIVTTCVTNFLAYFTMLSPIWMCDFPPIHFDVLHLNLFFIVLLPQGYQPLGGH